MYNIKELVKDNKVRFLYYRKGELWYEVIKLTRKHESQFTTEDDIYDWEQIFIFPVPIEDTGDGQFNVEDKAIIFMRYIRKYLEVLDKDTGRSVCEHGNLEPLTCKLCRK